MKRFCCVIGLILSSLIHSGLQAEPFVQHPSAESISDLFNLPDNNQLPFSGRVLVAIHGNSYSYVQVELEEGQLWLAAPRVRLQKGQKIRFPPGAQMLNFYSKTLQRTFKQILFVRQVRVVAEES